MLVMTAKVDKKKIAVILAAVVVIIVALVLLFGGGEADTTTAAPSMATNDGRVKFLTDMGWEVAASPVESGQVRIPDKSDEVYDRYNALQKSQGYDLSQYGGKTVMRYVYKVSNYPGATEPVYATLLIYKNAVIGGDVTDTAANGTVRGLKKPQSSEPAPTTAGETASTPTATADAAATGDADAAAGTTSTEAPSTSPTTPST
ncbi:MAG TPA: DUF4830 domain-containing protein [Candidatus Faecousia intestinigallinarum]|nr:DUF4830 domain-containing protein [Candidatus Faecousia intestinigallinarum]